MKFQITWKKSDGTTPTEVFSINPDDPHKDDQELQIAKAKAAASALSTQRKSETAQNAVNQQTPDVSSILARAATAGNSGMSSTMTLGKTTLLGARLTPHAVHLLSTVFRFDSSSTSMANSAGQDIMGSISFLY